MYLLDVENLMLFGWVVLEGGEAGLTEGRCRRLAVHTL